MPAYELAVVVDDVAMGVTEVVRGADLLTSTARQILIYRALNAQPPAFFHCPLLLDKDGRRLAKRDAALSLRALRAQGYSPEDVIAQTKLPDPDRGSYPTLMLSLGRCRVQYSLPSLATRKSAWGSVASVIPHASQRCNVGEDPWLLRI